jgi:hypothetical protein
MPNSTQVITDLTTLAGLTLTTASLTKATNSDVNVKFLQAQAINEFTQATAHLLQLQTNIDSADPAHTLITNILGTLQ